MLECNWHYKMIGMLYHWVYNSIPMLRTQTIVDLFTLYHQSQNPDCSIVLFQEHLRLLIAHYTMHSISDVYNDVSVVYINLPCYVLRALLPVLIRSEDWVTTIFIAVPAVDRGWGLECFWPIRPSNTLWLSLSGLFLLPIGSLLYPSNNPYIPLVACLSQMWSLCPLLREAIPSSKLTYTLYLSWKYQANHQYFPHYWIYWNWHSLNLKLSSSVTSSYRSH